MADHVQEWCMNLARCAQTSRTMIISGPFGFGKTQCLRAAYRYARDVSSAVWPEPWAHPISAYFTNWPDFVADVERNDNQERIEDLANSDAIFIDDIGAEVDRFKSGLPTQVLGDILSRIERKFTMITTNIEMNAWAGRWDRRVEDRLYRRGAIIVDLWRPELGAQSYAKVV